MFGAQYLHSPIPGVAAGDFEIISYQLRGTVEDYRRKVYGPLYDGAVSPGSLPAGHQAWDIRKTYDTLWQVYKGWIHHADVNHEWLFNNTEKFDMVFSTIPAPALCRDQRHHFEYQGIWAFGDAPARGQKVYLAINEGDVICNGKPSPSWYRASRIFGHTTLEWSMQGPVPRQHVSEVRKPLWTDCTCWPGITRLGRYGKWQKGVLVHHVYPEVIECLAAQE
jgi:hypothetical protein